MLINLAEPYSHVYRTPLGNCLSKPKISNMANIFLSALRGEILTQTAFPGNLLNCFLPCAAGFMNTLSKRNDSLYPIKLYAM